MTDKQELEAPDIVAVLPLRETVLFPQAVLPLSAGRASSVRLVEEAVRASRLIGVVTQRDSAEEDPGADGLYPIGVLARIHKAAKQADGTVRLVVQGISRFRLVEVLEDKPFLRARVQPVADPSDAASDVESQALMRNAMALFRKVVALSPLLPDEAANLPVNILHPGWTNTPGERKFFTDDDLKRVAPTLPAGRLRTVRAFGWAAWRLRVLASVRPAADRRPLEYAARSPQEGCARAR